MGRIHFVLEVNITTCFEELKEANVTLITLKVENFAGTKFRGSKKTAKFLCFAGIKFRGCTFQVSFASIKFRGRTFQVNFAGIKFRGY